MPTMDTAANPLVFSVIGENTMDDAYNKHYFVQRIVIYGGASDGNLMFLNHDGDGDRVNDKGYAISQTIDPVVISEGLVGASTRTETVVNRPFKNFFLDDIPDGGKVEVFYGEPHNA